MFIFLDESGDLGFDEHKTGASKFFTITLLVCDDAKAHRGVQLAVRHTLRKINRKKGKKRFVHELKAAKTTVAVKSYFLGKMPPQGWRLYAISLNKSRAFQNLRTKDGKKKLYNFLTKELLKKLNPHDRSASTVNLIADKCKDSADRKDFNAYIRANLETAFPLETAIHITHESSQENKGLQAVDLFCWGIQRQKTSGQDEWFERFKTRVACHVHYLGDKKEGACAA